MCFICRSKQVEEAKERQEVRTFLAASEALLQLHALLFQLSQVCLDLTELPLDLLRWNVIRLHLKHKRARSRRDGLKILTWAA